jgi:RNA polymerase sigma factor (sigma-70 family)
MLACLTGNMPRAAAGGEPARVSHPGRVGCHLRLDDECCAFGLSHRWCAMTDVMPFHSTSRLAELRRLFDRMYPILVRFLYKRVWDTDVAEDIAQEAFVRLLDERPDKPDAWLFTVADNLAKNAVRDDKRRTQRLTLIAGSPAPPPSETDRVLLRTESVREVRHALDALSERDRTLLLLREDGVSYKELARIVGVKASSVAPLLARARQRFLTSIEVSEHHDQTTAS